MKFPLKKPLLVYHGTNTKSGLGQKSGFYPGTYTSKSKEAAQGFGENVETLQVDSSKIFPLADADDLKRKAAKAGFGFHAANGRSEANYLKSHGYIGMARGNEVILFPFKKQSVRSYIAKNLSAKLRLRELARGDYAIPAVEAILGRKLGAGVKDALRNRGQRIHTPPPEFVGKKLKSEAEAQLKGKGLAGERQVQYTDVVPTLVLPDRFRPSQSTPQWYTPRYGIHNSQVTPSKLRSILKDGLQARPASGGQPPLLFMHPSGESAGVVGKFPHIRNGRGQGTLSFLTENPGDFSYSRGGAPGSITSKASNKRSWIIDPDFYGGKPLSGKIKQVLDETGTKPIIPETIQGDGVTLLYPKEYFGDYNRNYWAKKIKDNRSKNLSAKLRLRELAEKFHLPYSVAKKIVNGIKGRGISIVRMRNEPSNVGYRGWGDVPVAKIERGSNRKPFADLLHEAGHVDAGHLGSRSRLSEQNAELLKGAEGYYPRAHHESSDDILNAARGVLLREKQANRAAGKILKDSGASPEQISAFAKEQRKNFRTYRKNAWRHAVAGERIKNPSATESDVMGFLQRQAERRGVIPSDGALRSARESVQRQIRMNPINRGPDPIFHNESFGVDGSKSILPLTISEAKRIHKNTSKLWRVREFARGDYAIPALTLSATEKAVFRHYYRKLKKQTRGGEFAVKVDSDKIEHAPLLWRGATRPEIESIADNGRFVSNWQRKGVSGTWVTSDPDLARGYAAGYAPKNSRIYAISPDAFKHVDNKTRRAMAAQKGDLWARDVAPLRGGIFRHEVRGILKPFPRDKKRYVGWRPVSLGEVMRKDFESAKLRLRELALGAGTRIRHIPLKERRLITQKLRAAFPGEGAVQGLPRMIRTEKGGDMILSYRAASQKQRLVFPHSHLANPADPDALMAKELRKSKGGIKVAVSNRGHQVAPQDASIGTTTSRFFVGTFGVPYLGVYATPISKIQSRVEVGKYGFPNLNATKAGFNRHWESEVAQPNGGNIIAVRESVGRNEVAGNPEEIKSQFGRRNRRRVSSRQEEIVIPRGERGGRDKFVEALAKRNNKQLSAKLRLRELARSGRLVEFGAVATKTNPDLWAAKVAAAKRKFGKWSARASQWAVREYKSDGGGYRGKKSSSNSMAKWTRQKWRTRDGDKAERRDSEGRKVVARYLPDAKWKSLSPGEAAATDAKKRKASREGKQVVANTEKAKVRELSERLVELARVQSVTGQILNINPVPRKVADPILRSLRRKLEKGGDKQAVRGVFGVSRPQRASMPVFNHATGTPSWAKVWNPVKPKLVEIDGKKSILHYRGADAEDSLRVPRHDTFVLSGEYDRSLASEGLPKEIRQKYSKSAKSRVKLKQAGIDNEGSMRSHISQNTGGAISTSVNPSVSREYLTGKEPVFGVYATSLNDLIRNQQRKTGGSIVNNAFPFEQEITQVHGNNLLKTRPYKLDGQRYTRQRSH